MSKVRIGLLGCGGFMGAHAKRLKDHPDATIVALCDVSEAQVDAYIERNLADYVPAPATFTDPAEMYRESSLDAVIIATPHTLHFQHCMQALDAGLHVYVEKPMVTQLHQAYTLADRVEETGKILVVGYNSPCAPGLVYLRDVIRNGDLGALELVTGHLTQNWKKGTAGKWRQDPKLSGGGQAYDSGAHLLNALCWCVESDIEEVFAYVDQHGTEVDINSVMSVKFASGVFANITVSGNCASGYNEATFIFENGRIVTDACGWAGTWVQVYEGGQKVEDPPVKEEMGSPSPTHNFIDVILGRAEPRTSPRNGIIQCQLMDAFYESARTGKPVRPADLT